MTRQVSMSTTPSTARPLARWKSMTSCWVPFVNRSSATRPAPSSGEQLLGGEHRVAASRRAAARPPAAATSRARPCRRARCRRPPRGPRTCCSVASSKNPLCGAAWPCSLSRRCMASTTGPSSPTVVVGNAQRGVRRCRRSSCVVRRSSCRRRRRPTALLQQERDGDGEHEHRRAEDERLEQRPPPRVRRASGSASGSATTSAACRPRVRRPERCLAEAEQLHVRDRGRTAPASPTRRGRRRCRSPCGPRRPTRRSGRAGRSGSCTAPRRTRSRRGR